MKNLEKLCSRGLLWLILALYVFSTLATSICAVPKENLSHTKVEVGAYLVDLNEIDLKTSSFNADFYLWMRWHGDLNPGKFEAMNGQMQLIGDPDVIDKGDSHYRCWRCNGKFRAQMDFHRYPTDTHLLEIQLEDSTHDRKGLVYVPDQENLAQGPRFYLGPWEQGGPIKGWSDQCKGHHVQVYDQLWQSYPLEGGGCGVFPLHFEHSCEACGRSFDDLCQDLPWALYFCGHCPACVPD